MTGARELIGDYLARLERATADLPVQERDELRDDIRSHLDEIHAAGASEAELRDALDRLGSPESIAEAAGATTPPPPTPAPAARPSSRALDVLAVVLLLVGGIVIPGVGWVLGVVLLWVSSSWTVGERIVGTLILPGGLAAPLALGLFAARGGVCSSETAVVGGGEAVGGGEIALIGEDCLIGGPWLGGVMLAVATIAPIVVAVVLLRRAERRRRRPAAT